MRRSARLRFAAAAEVEPTATQESPFFRIFQPNSSNLRNGIEEGDHMPKYLFSWEHFSKGVVRALAFALLDAPENIEPNRAIELLNKKFPNPSEAFVKEHLDVLIDGWLGHSERSVTAIIRQWTKKHPASSPASKRWSTRRTFLLQRRRTDSFIKIVTEELRLEGYHARTLIPLRPHAAAPPKKKPFEHQEESIRKLKTEFDRCQKQKTEFRRLLVLPTGAGKTFTAVRWIVTDLLNTRKCTVLWLAHREELLEQAASTFAELAPLARSRSQIRLRYIKSKDSVHSITEDRDDIIICSVAKLARNLDRAKKIFSQRNRLIVVDEAHHSVADTYKKLLDLLPAGRARRHCKLLGLTATPTRTCAKERPLLAKYFGGNVIDPVTIDELIVRRQLARPTIISVQTKVDVCRGMRDGQIQRELKQNFGDLSNTTLKRISKMVARNKAVVDHYLAKRKEYGKTLIFAINCDHAKSLAKLLKDHHVNAKVVVADNRERHETIAQFRDGQFDVLVNVMICNEGVDVPDIQTVILARPTFSEILLRQMIGRALRGPKCGGTETANLVSFEDHWTQGDWKRPIELAKELKSYDERVRLKPELAEIVGRGMPWDAIETIAGRVAGGLPETKLLSYYAFPTGFVELKAPGGTNTFLHLAYSHDWTAWSAVCGRLAEDPRTAPDELHSLFLDAEHELSPVVEQKTLERLQSQCARSGAAPRCIRFETVEKCCPNRLAKALVRDKASVSQVAKAINKVYQSNEVAQHLFPSASDYGQTVYQAIADILNPPACDQFSPGMPLVDFDDTAMDLGEDRPRLSLKPILSDVIREGSALLGDLARGKVLPSIEWTTNVLWGYFGRAEYPATDSAPGSGRIKINRILRFSEVPEEVLRYVVWHEYLHVRLRCKHTREFRELERKWKNSSDREQYLTKLNTRTQKLTDW